MTEEKMRKVIAACVSAATALLVTLFSVLVYQWVSMGIYNKRIDKLETEIAQLKQVVAQAKMDAEYYESEFYLTQKLVEYQQLKDKN